MISVRLTPKSSRDGLDGVQIRANGAAMLKARVRAAPEDGKANAALVKLMAAVLGVSASAVALASGAKARTKAIEIRGEPAQLVARLKDVLTAF